MKSIQKYKIITAGDMGAMEGPGGRVSFFSHFSFNILSLPGYLAAEQCNILGLFKASSTRWSSTPSTTTSLMQPTKPVL